MNWKGRLRLLFLSIIHERNSSFPCSIICTLSAFHLNPEKDSPFFEASIFDLLTAFSKILKNVPKETFHKILKDEFTVSEKIHDIFHMLVNEPKIYFSALFNKAKSKLEIIVTFLAVLELIRLKEILVIQEEPFAEIEIIRNSGAIKSETK